MIELDKFEHMFSMQRVLQKRLGTEYNQKFINEMCLALHAETTELLDSTPWKSWKKNQAYDDKNYIYELADILHFTINLAIARGISSEELYIEFVKKNKENHERQDRGY